METLGIEGVLRNLEDVRRFGRACLYFEVVGTRQRMDDLFRRRLLWDAHSGSFTSWDDRVEELSSWQPPLAPLALEARLRLEYQDVVWAVLVARNMGFYEERCGELISSMLANSYQRFMEQKDFDVLLTSCMGLQCTGLFSTMIRRSMMLTLGQRDEAGRLGRTWWEFSSLIQSDSKYAERLLEALKDCCDEP